jgi:hypothetical protein
MSLFARQAATALRFATSRHTDADHVSAGLPPVRRAAATRLIRELEDLLLEAPEA